MKDPRRELRSFRKAAAALKRKTRRQGLPCWICQRPFDWSLHYLDRGGFTADHVHPLARGGSVNGPLRPAHRGCNSRRNDERNVAQMPTTRPW